MLQAGLQLASLGAAVAVMALAWAVSVRARDASLADVAWGICFVAIGWSCVVVGSGAGERSTLIAILVSVWGLRLAAYIGWRHDGEDRRYRAMRERHGSGFALRSLWSVFGLQALIAGLVSLPIQAAAADATPAGLGAAALAGAAVCVAAICFESVADLQLARFLRREDAAGTVMDEGLWRLSRHPNYFGDACFWWGVWLVALESGSSWWTAVGPALMTFLLVRVSGVALTERSISDRRPAYRDYVERTSAFVPLPPRR